MFSTTTNTSFESLMLSKGYQPDGYVRRSTGFRNVLTNQPASFVCDGQSGAGYSLGLIYSDVLDQEALRHEITGQSVFHFIICFGVIQVSNKDTEA